MVASGFFMVIFVLLAVVPRMTIHHSERQNKQVNSGRIGPRERSVVGWKQSGTPMAVLEHGRTWSEVRAEERGSNRGTADSSEH
jgi:SH3-like domain-containing protein